MEVNFLSLKKFFFNVLLFTVDFSLLIFLLLSLIIIYIFLRKFSKRQESSVSQALTIAAQNLQEQKRTNHLLQEISGYLQTLIRNKDL